MFQHLTMTGRFHQRHVEEVDIVTRIRCPVAVLARSIQCGINALQPVLDRDLAQSRLHGFGFHQPEFVITVCDSCIGRVLDRSAGRYDHVPTHRAIGDDVDAKDMILGPVAFYDHRAGAGTYVEQERSIEIRQVDKMRSGVTTSDQDCIDVRVIGHQAAGKLQRGDSRRATRVNIYAPGVPRPDFPAEIDCRRPQKIFPPLFSGAENNVDFQRVDAGCGDSLACCMNGHFIGVDFGIRDELALDSQLFSHDPLGQTALLSDLFRGDVRLRKVRAGGDDAHAGHAGSLRSRKSVNT